MKTVWDILASIGLVLWRRLRGRRRHPSMGLVFEIGVEVCARQVAIEKVLPGGVRKPQAALPVPAPLWGRLRHERVQLAAMPAERHTSQGFDDDGPVVLYLHGGGYFACSPGTHRALVARLTHAARARAYVPDYRLAPEHPYPAAVDDCLACYRALLDDGLDPARLFVGGDSAGGGLTLAVLQRLLAAGEPLPRGLLLLSPWVDLEAEGGSMVDNLRADYLPGGELGTPIEAYVGDRPRSDPMLSPIHADLRGAPPVLMLTGELEIFVDQNLAFAERLRAQGVELTHVVEPNMVHVYPLLADVSRTARRSFRKMAEFIRAHRAGTDDRAA